MGRIERIQTVCDLHEQDRHTEDDKIEAVSFGFEGIDYEIDLCEAAAADLRDTLRTHADVGRLVKKPAATNGTTNATERSRQRGEAAAEAREKREYLGAVREWAVKNGWQVAPRGRVANEIIEAFENVHNPKPAPQEHQGDQGDQGDQRQADQHEGGDQHHQGDHEHHEHHQGDQHHQGDHEQHHAEVAAEPVPQQQYRSAVAPPVFAEPVPVAG